MTTQTTFQVWYMRPDFWTKGILGDQPNKENLAATHIHLKDLVLDGGSAQLERVFHMMQGEVWSPNGEAFPLLTLKGLHHTSMSVGDAIVVDGSTYVVATFGFDRL